MTRKLFAVLMVLALLASIVPAVINAEEPEEDLSWLKDWTGVKLTLSSHTGPTTDAYKELAKEFEELTGAEVVVIDESWTDLLSKHLAAFAAHTGDYDILTWPYVWFGHYVEGDMVENLNDWFAKEDLIDADYDLEDFVPAILEAYGRYTTGFYTDPDALWSVPYKFDVYLAFYRPDVWVEAGIVDEDGNAKLPETWEELAEHAKIISEKVPDIVPLAIPLIIDDPTVSTFLPIFVSYGGEPPMPWFDENLYPAFYGEEAVNAVNALKDLMPYMPADALEMDYDSVNAFMAQGEAAYGLNWNAYLPVLLDPEKSKISDSVGFDLVPGGPAGRPQGLGGWQMGISKDSANKEAAFQLLQFLTGKNRGPRLALAGGSVARYSTAEDPEIVEAFPYYPLLLEAVENVAVRGMDRSWVEQQMTIAVAVNEILLGADPEETLLKAAEQSYKQAQAAGYTPEETGPAPGTE